MEVLDEPLYPAFLRVTGFDRPYREEILSKIVSFNYFLLSSNTISFEDFTLLIFVAIAFYRKLI